MNRQNQCRREITAHFISPFYKLRNGGPQNRPHHGKGALALSRAAVLAMGLPYLAELDADLSYDTNVPVDVHVGTVVSNRVERDVAVFDMGRRPLLGTALLEGFHFGADFVDAGLVSATLAFRLGSGSVVSH